MERWLYQHFVYPLADAVRRRNNIECLRFLRESQYWPRHRIKEWQLRKLKRILIHCQEHVPFYRRRFAEVEFDPYKLAGLQDMERLPILTKKDIQHNFKSLSADNIQKWRTSQGRTGGSTAEPMRFLKDKPAQSWNSAARMRNIERLGFIIGSRSAMLTGHPPPNSFAHICAFLNFRMQLLRKYPVTVINHEVLDKHIRDINKWRPKVVYGYSSALYLLSKRILETSTKLPSVQFYVSSSEILFPQWREEIENITGKPVYNWYGLLDAEVGHECKQKDGFHLNPEINFVEIVNESGKQIPPGEVGLVVVTHFFNEAFPYVRYSTGDMALRIPADEVCGCGVTLPKIGQVQGRESDILQTPEKSILAPYIPYYLSYHRNEITNIETFQIIQDRLDHIIFKIKTTSGELSDHQRQNFVAALHDLLGQEVSIDVELVDEIPLTISGKRRFIVSKLEEGHLPRR